MELINPSEEECFIKLETAKPQSAESLNLSVALRNTDTKRVDLYNRLQKGLNDISHGNTRPFAEAMADVKSKRNKSL